MGAAENAVVKACMETLEHLGVPHMRNNSGAVMVPDGKTGRRRPIAFGKKGWPDIIGVLPDGRFLAVECKKPDDPITGRRSDLSPEQLAVRYDLLKAGALYLTVRGSQEMSDDLKSEGYFRKSSEERWTFGPIVPSWNKGPGRKPASQGEIPCITTTRSCSTPSPPCCPTPTCGSSGWPTTWTSGTAEPRRRTQKATGSPRDGA